MQNIQLNACELLYIASLFDVDELYGISDGFYGMDEAEIAAEINNVKRRLNDKGYAEMDFDGNFNIKDEVMKVIEVCVKQDMYIAFDKVQKTANAALRLYIKDHKVVKVVGDHINYTVQTTDINSIKSDLLSFVNWTDDKRILKEKETFIENELLRKVKGMNELDDPEKELKLMGCSNIKSKILYGGLTGDAEYYAMIIIDFTAEEQDVYSLIFIHSSDGILKLTPDLDAEKEGVQLSTVSQGDISEDITEAITRYVPNDAEEFK